jgi:surface antigen
MIQGGSPMRPRWLAVATAGMALWLAAAPVQAQVNPFRSDRLGRSMSQEDRTLMTESIDRLNATPNLRVGQTDSWSNPQTGSSGVNTVQGNFRANGMPCHRVQHFIARGDRPEGSTFSMTWCRTAQGAWKMRG